MADSTSQDQQDRHYRLNGTSCGFGLVRRDRDDPDKWEWVWSRMLYQFPDEATSALHEARLAHPTSDLELVVVISLDPEKMVLEA